MKKHIILICEGNQQFGVIVEELSVLKTMKQIVDDLSNPLKQFICLTDYVSAKDLNQKMYVKSKIVNAIVLTDVNNNVQVPNRKLIVPSVLH